jgi:hypothetical protein
MIQKPEDRPSVAWNACANWHWERDGLWPFPSSDLFRVHSARSFQVVLTLNIKRRQFMSMQQRLFCGLILTFSTTVMAEVNTFNDIDNWTGTGDNKAAFVIDWHDGSGTARAWGVQFDGTITAASAMRQILVADNRLYGVVNGAMWLGYGYDVDGTGAQGVTDPLGVQKTAVGGVVEDANSNWYMLPASTPLDSADRYASYSYVDASTSQGWGLYVPDTTVYDDKGTTSGPNYWEDDDAVIGASVNYSDATFVLAGQGVGTMSLQDGSWFGFSYGTNENYVHQAALSASADLQPASVPEPLTMSLLAMGGLGLLRRRKK